MCLKILLFIHEQLTSFASTDRGRPARTTRMSSLFFGLALVVYTSRLFCLPRIKMFDLKLPWSNIVCLGAVNQFHIGKTTWVILHESLENDRSQFFLARTPPRTPLRLPLRQCLSNMLWIYFVFQISFCLVIYNCTTLSNDCYLV